MQHRQIPPPLHNGASVLAGANPGGMSAQQASRPGVQTTDSGARCINTNYYMYSRLPGSSPRQERHHSTGLKRHRAGNRPGPPTPSEDPGTGLDHSSVSNAAERGAAGSPARSCENLGRRGRVPKARDSCASEYGVWSMDVYYQSTIPVTKAASIYVHENCMRYNNTACSATSEAYLSNASAASRCLYSL